MLPIIRILNLLFLAACTLCCSASAVNGQSYLIRIDATDDGTKATKKMLETLKQAALFRYQGEAKCYQDILDLDESTEKKLSIAAKGAALKLHRKQAETIIRNLRRYQQQAGIKVEMDDLNLDDDHPNDEDGNAQEPMAVNRAFSFGMSMPTIEPIDNQPIWQTAIGKLSAKQLRRFDQERAKRELKLQQKIVESFLVSVQLQVLATEQQIEKLRPIVNRELGPALLHGAKNFTVQNRGLVRFDQAIAVPKYSKAAFEVLDEDQQREWTRTVEPSMTPLYNTWLSSQRAIKVRANKVRAIEQFRPLGFPAARLIPAMKVEPKKKPVDKKPKDADKNQAANKTGGDKRTGDED